MNIGSLQHRITLQSETRTSDSMGGFTITWTDEATVWASIWDISASEFTRANSTNMVVSNRIRIRYPRNVTIKADWRVKFGSRYFAIVSIINPNEQNKMLELLCKETAS